MTIQHHNNSQRGGQLVEKPLAFQTRSSSHILYYFPLYHHHQNRSCWILSSPEFQLRRSKRFRSPCGGEKALANFVVQACYLLNRYHNKNKNRPAMTDAKIICSLCFLRLTFSIHEPKTGKVLITPLNKRCPVA